MHSNKNITTIECKKNIQDINKIVDILENNEYLKDEDIIQELKDRRDHYVIKLFNSNNSFYMMDEAIGIELYEIDYIHHVIKIIFRIVNGDTYEKTFPLKEFNVIT